MMCEYIAIAVSHILNEYEDGIQRCCGSCNPSCDDLTRFICFGHTLPEIEEWIKNNPNILQAEFDKRMQEAENDFMTYCFKASQKEAK